MEIENNNTVSSSVAEPGFGVLTQYTKDLSFENFFKLGFQPKEGEEPKLDVKVKVDSKKLQDSFYEVVLFLAVSAIVGEEKLFIVELKYAGIFALENFQEEMIKPTLLIECPRILFPFARAVIAQSVASGNLPMPLLPMIDFVEIYENNASNTENKA